MATSRLLVIDGQPETFRPLVSCLSDKATEVIFAHSGMDGYAKAIAETPDAIMLDMAISGEGDGSICRRLKRDKRTAGIPVVCISPSESLDDKLRAFSHGAIDYLVKPFSELEAAARVLGHMETKRRIDRLQTMVAQAALERVGEHAFPDDLVFSQALAILEKRISDPPGLGELAHALGSNERKLTDIFRRRVGMTVFDYFSEVRLETARHLLESSRMRIQNIAAHVGYSNAGDFTRAFRRRYGASPRQHRRDYVAS